MTLSGRVSREPFLCPLFTIAVLVLQASDRPDVFIPIDVAAGRIPHVVIPGEVSDIRERVHLGHEAITVGVQVVLPDDRFSQGDHLIPSGS